MIYLYWQIIANGESYLETYLMRPCGVHKAVGSVRQTTLALTTVWWLVGLA